MMPDKHIDISYLDKILKKVGLYNKNSKIPNEI